MCPNQPDMMTYGATHQFWVVPNEMVNGVRVIIWDNERIQVSWKGEIAP